MFEELEGVVENYSVLSIDRIERARISPPAVDIEGSEIDEGEYLIVTLTLALPAIEK